MFCIYLNTSAHCIFIFFDKKQFHSAKEFFSVLFLPCKQNKKGAKFATDFKEAYCLKPYRT